MTSIRTALLWIAVAIGPVVVAAGLAYVLALVMPPVYAARTEIVFSIPEAAAVPEQYRATQVVVAQGEIVLRPVATGLKIPMATLAANLSADFPSDSGVLRLQYADTDAARALHVMEALTDQYLLVLDRLDRLDSATFQMLTPPVLLDAPIWPRPVLAAAIGAAVGVLISLLALVVLLGPRLTL